MAIMKIDVYAKTLNQTVTLQVIAPVESLQSGETCACLYLLHGVQGSYINWSTATHAFRLLGSYNAGHSKKLAIVMPSGANSFYHPAKGRNANYERFIGEELVQLTRAMLPLSTERADTGIAGLSMGGYGALRTGMLYPQVFGFAGGLSSALLTQNIAAHCREDGAFYENPEFLKATFGSLEGIENSQHDVMTLSHQLPAKSMPKLYLACGEQDGLLELSRALHADWEQRGIAHRYEEHEGAHEWAFWEWGLGRILDYIGEGMK